MSQPDQFLTIQGRVQPHQFAQPGTPGRDAFVLLCEVRRLQFVLDEILDATAHFCNTGDSKLAREAVFVIRELVLKQRDFVGSGPAP